MISFIDKFYAISCVIFSLSPTKEVSLYKPPEKEYWAILFIKSYGFYSKKKPPLNCFIGGLFVNFFVKSIDS